MIQEIYIVEDEGTIKDKIAKIFSSDKEIRVKTVTSDNLDAALGAIPSLIIVDEDRITPTANEICRAIRNNDDNVITPVIVLSSNTSHRHRLEILKLSVVQYIKNPIEEKLLYYTIKNILDLLYINRRVSPLTGLPGNVQIQAEIKKRLLKKKTFAMFYLDLDHFKEYNDVYGFLKGDEIIKFTAKTIVDNVKKEEAEDSFIGHVGGDDFIAVVGGEDADYDKICQNIIADFDIQLPKYFNKEDVERGYLEVPNRKGIIEEFPLTSISIGVVVVEPNRFSNVLEIGDAGAAVKHLAKTIQGSTYVIDRRNTIRNKYVKKLIKGEEKDND